MSWAPIAGAVVAVVAVCIATYVIITNRLPRPQAWITYQCANCERRFNDLRSLIHHETTAHLDP